jgi:outer membrane receptor for ferrienterochelin and colicins
MRCRLSVLIILLTNSYIQAQQKDTLTGISDDVVVTATRTEKKLGNVAVPVSIISQQKIQQAGSLRLNDILREQTGLFITTGFGAGVQMQGLSPDYTLILLNGEPFIGRTAGVLDLNRIGVGNIKQIEIVKGPSSSLYGSEAMAGVINIITDKPGKSFLNASARYGSYNTTDLSVNGGFKIKKWSYQGFGNYYHTAGFSIRPNSVERSVTPITRITQQHQIIYSFSEKTSLQASIRINQEDIRNEIAVTNNGFTTTSTGLEKNNDLNTSLQLNHRFSSIVKNTIRLYGSRFQSTQNLVTSNGAPYTDFFKQQFYRAENQTDINFSEKAELNIGVGYIQETANSTRYDNSNNTKTNRIAYGFAQTEWRATHKLTLIAGARYDDNEQFAAAFSPKIALRYKINSNLALKASVGRGFKAPDFRQLYLNFTNTAAGGYSVFGAVEAQKIISELASIGQIASFEADYYRLSSLEPEFSTGINIGLQYHTTSRFNASMNVFHNSIENLIDSRLVAYRTGGAQIFSYINIKSAFTQGVETEINYKPFSFLSISSGYQFLLTGDRSEIDQMNNGKVFTRDANGFSRRLRKDEYVGLPNRSKHMANLRIQYEKAHFFANTRFIYRGKWYTTDTDGNGIFNTNDAFGNGFVQVNTAVGNSFKNGIRLQTGCDNVFNYTDATNLPNLPGSIFYATISYSFLKNKTK